MTNRVYDRSTTTIEFDSGLKVTIWWKNGNPVVYNVGVWKDTTPSALVSQSNEDRNRAFGRKILQDPEAIHTLIHMARNGKTLAQIMETLNV